MTTTSRTMRELRPSELATAARLVGGGIRDNPVNVKAFGIPDAERRRKAMTRFFGPVLRGLHHRGVILGAFCDGALAGVCGMAPPGFCQPTALEKLNVLPSVIFGNPLGTHLRVLKWTGDWAHRDPSEPHWHLGPVAVDPQLQGQGIGSAMLDAFCERIDGCRMLSYLETDKSENVRFYQKFGFEVVAQAEVLGVPNWFMSRRSQPPPTM